MILILKVELHRQIQVYAPQSCQEIESNSEVHDWIRASTYIKWFFRVHYST
jgi:hypothetical protein